MKSKTRIRKLPKRANRVLDKLAKSLRGRDSVRVGLPKDSNDYPDGTSIIDVGIIHEFGSRDGLIPQRSFLRATIEANRREYAAMLKELARKIYHNELAEVEGLEIEDFLTKKETLQLIGERVKGDVIERMGEGISPQLRSRDGTPLVDTGHLRQSITYEIVD